jgi:hypothetical protein
MMGDFSSREFAKSTQVIAIRHREHFISPIAQDLVAPPGKRQEISADGKWPRLKTFGRYRLHPAN